MSFSERKGTLSSRLANKVAIITGAATGIGKAAALLFAQEGASVVIADIDEAGGQGLVEQIKSGQGEAIFVKTDVTDREQVAHLIQATLQTFGQLNILYNNAAVNLFARLTSTSDEDWDWVMTANVKSVFLCSKAAIPILQANGGGVIINTASAAAIVGLRNLAVYTASKGAVLQLTKNMALDYAADNIRVNALCPGVTATEMTLKVIESSPDPAAARKRFDSGRPMGRMAEPLEIARAALFLASEESSYMTGAHLVVDGGYTAE
jgi:meso-butanediol dehydrogenase/(S,S)-butanediol dehydrogenase/diacetyl reductase